MQHTRIFLSMSVAPALCRNEPTKDPTEGCDGAVQAAKKGEKVIEDRQSQDTQKAGTSDKEHVS